MFTQLCSEALSQDIMETPLGMFSCGEQLVDDGFFGQVVCYHSVALGVCRSTVC